MKDSTKEKFVYYKQLWAVLGELRVGVFTVDADRRITSFNRAAELLTGYKESKVVGKHCHAIFLNDLCYGDCKYHAAVEAEQDSLSFDLHIKDAHNEKHLVTKIVTPLYDANHQLTGCLEIFQDRSAFEELINRIRYDEQQLKIILDSLDIGVFTVTRGGLINFFNTKAEMISGHSRKDVLGKPCSMLLADEPEEDGALLMQSLKDGKSRSNSDGFMTAKDGKHIPIQADYMALRNEQGRMVGGMATFQDLSLIHQLNRVISNRYTFADMIGKDRQMQKLFEILPVVAASEATVLIRGATGTGKDLLAKVIHNASERRAKPLVKVNCAALPDNLLESEMFGYVKGAFTGADRDKPGRFQEAEGGTIFLDEIGDLPPYLQAKLLRVLEDREFYPLGSRKTTKVDVRIIAATNQDLEELVGQKRFREDLFYRLNVIQLELPPLRGRKGDLPLLIEHLFRQLKAAKGSGIKRLSEEALEILLNHDYPGNIRELENILEHALIICEGAVIEKKHLPLVLRKGISRRASAVAKQASAHASPDQYGEKEHILLMLNQHHWHRGRTAEALQIDRTTLWRKMRKYNL